MLACRLGEYADILRDYSTDNANARFMIEARLDGRYYERLLKVTRAIPDGTLLAKAFSIIIDMMNLSLISRALIRGMGSAAAELVTGGGYLITAALAQELLGGKLTDMPAAFAGSQYHEIVDEMINTYNRNHNVAAVDEIIDRHRFRLLRDMLSPRVLSPLVIGWYLLLKEIEVRDLRLIFKVTFDGIPVEEIKEYLVSA
jgi:vacuolar-type H+-ATPase subunit C/Vma6